MMADEKKFLEAPKKVVDGLVEVFDGLAQMFSGVSDQLDKIQLEADPEDEMPYPVAEAVAPALPERKGAAVPHPRKKPVKKTRKADIPVEAAEPDEAPVVEDNPIEDEVNSGSSESTGEAAAESDAGENDSADSEFPVDDADALPWSEDTGQPDTPPAEAEPQETKAAPAVTITKDDITAVIVGKIKKKRSNNEKIGQLLKAYGCKELSALPPEKYEAFLSDISQL